MSKETRVFLKVLFGLVGALFLIFAILQIFGLLDWYYLLYPSYCAESGYSVDCTFSMLAYEQYLAIGIVGSCICFAAYCIIDYKSQPPKKEAKTNLPLQPS
jgi:hypothetical protein